MIRHIEARRAPEKYGRPMRLATTLLVLKISLKSRFVSLRISDVELSPCFDTGPENSKSKLPVLTRTPPSSIFIDSRSAMSAGVGRTNKLTVMNPTWPMVTYVTHRYFLKGKHEKTTISRVIPILGCRLFRNIVILLSNTIVWVKLAIFL